jgi:hypothetical protein
MLTADSILNNLPGDKSAIRRYVTSAASTALADGSVAVNVTHSNLRQLVQELRFDLHTTIADVKRRLYTFNGSSQEAMELHLKDASGNLLARMLDESRPLGYYGCASGMTIHCVDNDPYSLSRNGGCVCADACASLSRAPTRALTPSRAAPRNNSFSSHPVQPRRRVSHREIPHVRGGLRPAREVVPKF